MAALENILKTKRERTLFYITVIVLRSRPLTTKKCYCQKGCQYDYPSCHFKCHPTLTAKRRGRICTKDKRKVKD